MSKGYFKTILIITFLIVSSISLPLMVSADNGNSSSYYGTEQTDTGDFLTNPSTLMGGIGGAMGMFGQFGFGGAVLGQILGMLFLQGLNISSTEKMPGVFVLNATLEEERTFTVSFGQEDQRYYWIPWEYYRNQPVWENHSGSPFCVVNKTGYANYTFTYGAAITIIIWDSDYSFIEVLKRVVELGKKIFRVSEEYEHKFEGTAPTESEQEEMQNAMIALVGEAASVLAYIILHINDIINGDELLMVNPITWQSLLIETSDEFNVTKNWYYYNGTPPHIYPLQSEDADINEWNAKANAKNDEYMQWLLSSQLIGGKLSNKWTQFTFDLLQLWVKNFHIEIDAAAIIELLAPLMGGIGGGGGVGSILMAQDGGTTENPFASLNVAKIFQGCDIEFYLFTHHLTGAFLYNDSDDNRQISVTYDTVLNKTTEEPILIDNKTVQVPNSTEVTHKILLGTVNDFEFKSPVINLNEKGVPESISWGLDIKDVNISAVPIGIDMEDYVGDVPQENLDYIFFGFTFIPNITDSVETKDGTIINVASAKVKLDQFFAPWNDGNGPNGDITGLDMAIVYLSTALHVHFNLSLDELGEKTLGGLTDDTLMTEDDYHEEEHALYIGNYFLQNKKLEFKYIDIAGPYYEQENETGTYQYPANTSIIPLGLFEAGVSDFSTYISEEDPAQSFTSEGFINTEYNVMLYSVNYWTFDGSGDGIFHDPTFSVFMTWEATGFLSIILLLGGITLVGVATILITRHKNKKIR